MTRLKFLFLLATLAATSVQAASDDRDAGTPVLLDRVVAVVNTDVVTRLDLDQQIQLATQQLKRQGTPLPAPDVLERQLLERMVTSKVLVQLARDTGVRVDDTQLQRAIDRIAQDNKLTAEAIARSSSPTQRSTIT
jgi:peptidyl-prolyl cis-trans isomerase SurA